VTAVNVMGRVGRWRGGRMVGVLLLVAGLLTMSAVPAGAVPTVAENSDTAAVAAWPVELQQLVNGTSAFASAPWFTQGPCAGRGGDVAGYINTFFQRESAFRREVMRDLQQKAPDLIDDLTVAQVGAADTVFPNGNAAYEMPAGTCAADLRSWTTADDSSPWGFRWVSRPDPQSLQAMARDAAAQPGTLGDVLDGVNPLTVCAGDNLKSYLCARAFFVNCEVAAAADTTRCRAWNTAVQRHLNGMNHWIEQNTSLADRIGEFLVLAGGVAVWVAGGWVISALGFLLDKLGDAVEWAAKKGMDQVVSFAVAGAVWLWGKVVAYLIDQSTPNLLGGGFVDTYNIISGIMMGIAFLIFLAGLTSAWKRGRLAGSLVGAVKAVIGIQVVGIIAWLMLELANQATKALLAAQTQQLASSHFTLAIASLYPPVAFIAAILLIFGLIGTAIVLFFQAPATLGHALFGTIAAAGQAHEGTSQWLGRWFIRLLSLAWCKFFMVGMALVAMNLVMPTMQNSEQNFGQQFFSVLLGLTLMVLLPTTPWLLSGLMSFTVGHASQFADRLAMGVTQKIGAAAMAAANGAVTGGAGAVDGAATASGSGAGSGAAGGGGSKAALATMGNNLSSLDDGTAVGSGSPGTGGNASGDEQDAGAEDGSTTGHGQGQGSAGAGSAAGVRSGGDGKDQGAAAAAAGGTGGPGGGTGQPGSGQSSGQKPAGQYAPGQTPGQDPAGAAAGGRGTPGVGGGRAAGATSDAPTNDNDDTGDAVASPEGATPPGAQPAGPGGRDGQGPSMRAAASTVSGGAPAAATASATGAGSSTTAPAGSTAAAAGSTPAAPPAAGTAATGGGPSAGGGPSVAAATPGAAAAPTTPPAPTPAGSTTPAPLPPSSGSTAGSADPEPAAPPPASTPPAPPAADQKSSGSRRPPVTPRSPRPA
jgi:hypothetical protein